MNNVKQIIGQKGEKIAIEFLKKMGFEIITQNYHTRLGEVDIIAKIKKEFVFVEVKTRKIFSQGRPQEAVNQEKQKKIIQTAQLFLQKNQLNESDWRIDVIAIDLSDEDNPQIEHIKNAVTFF